MADITVGPTAGIDCVLYYNSGTHASPTWVAIPNARDVMVPDWGCNQVPANARASRFEANVNGRIKSGLTFGYLHLKGADTVRDALAGMVSGRAPKEFAVMDGAIALVGARGIRAYMNMENFGNSQGDEDAAAWDASLKPAYFVESGAKVDPDLYIVT